MTDVNNCFIKLPSFKVIPLLTGRRSWLALPSACAAWWDGLLELYVLVHTFYLQYIGHHSLLFAVLVLDTVCIFMAFTIDSPIVCCVLVKKTISWPQRCSHGNGPDFTNALLCIQHSLSLDTYMFNKLWVAMVTILLWEKVILTNIYDERFYVLF